MPDISLLAPIARMLHTDINDLFSFQKEITEKDVDIFMEQIRNECESKGYQEGMEQAFGFWQAVPGLNSAVSLRMLFFLLLSLGILLSD